MGNEFERYDFKVLPIQDMTGTFHKRPNFDGHGINWSEPDTWVDWQEREDFYPDCHDWYVLPPKYVDYYADGVTWGYYVIDIDTGHAKDEAGKREEAKRFQHTIATLKRWGIPRSLTVRTASGGLHIYYRAPIEFLPASTQKAFDENGTQLSMEIKTSVGWVAPNGRDRLVIVDEPIAVFFPKQGTPLGDSVGGMRKRAGSKIQMPVNPNFDISFLYPIKDVLSGDRHNYMLTQMIWLREHGCPKDKAVAWAEAFYEHNGRTPQRNEIENAWDWEGATEFNPKVIDKPLLKDPILEIFPGAVELTGKEAEEARNVFWV